MTNKFVDIELYREGIEAKLEGKTKMDKFVNEESVETIPGSKINVITHGYVGDAVTFAKGEAIPVSDMEDKEVEVTFEQVGKAVRVYDIEAKSTIGNPLDRAQKQTVEAINGFKAKSVYEVLKNAQVTHKLEEGEAINVDAVLEALDVFEADLDEGNAYLLCSKKTKLALQSALNRGVNTTLINQILDLEIVTSTHVQDNEAFVIQGRPVKRFVQKSVEVEPTRDTAKKATEIYTDTIIGTFIEDQTKVVYITTADSGL